VDVLFGQANELHAEAAHWEHHWDWKSDRLDIVVVAPPDNLDRFRKSIGENRD
jgi:Mn-dependent DtxR family transcriptional regulator